jgi:hypothetical protein
MSVSRAITALVTFLTFASWAHSQDAKLRPLERTAKNGVWSDPRTWESGKVPSTGSRVQIRRGHTVTYDAGSDAIIRFIHVAGALSFAPDKDTRLNVGLIKIQAGDDASEAGFDCDAHMAMDDKKTPLAALEVGTPNRPIDAKHTAVIRLHYITGMDKGSCPAIVCCGGRMDFHGTPMPRTWLKLGAAVKAGDMDVTLDEAGAGWKIGDRVIITATTRQQKTKKTFQPSVKDNTQTEERVIKAIAGTTVTLDQPLKFAHAGDGDYRAEVANLSRNVVVESALPPSPSGRGAGGAGRGHTMYHHGSAGAISYAEFRHLGMPGVLGRYSLHYHLCSDSMRGSYVIGASIWDSGNRWLTVHGTNYLVVRDCVGYQSLGHGFFLEDGTEVFNVFDRNLAVHAYNTKPLPKQIIPFDKNDGAGFWWANSHNTFTRNVAAECDEYGYFFQAAKTPAFDPNLKVMQPDGTKQRVDIRTLPFVRFEDNVSHCQRRHGFNLGGGVPFGEPNVGGVGPDANHPFIIKNFKAYNVHWPIHPVSPSVLIENMDIQDAEYGIWRPVYNRHAYDKINFTKVPPETTFAFEVGSRPKLGDVKSLSPIDDEPPTTVITHIRRLPLPPGRGVGGEGGQVAVRGVSADNGTITKVLVNGRSAKATRPNFAEWEITLDQPRAETARIEAYAEDAAGNVEKRRHVVEFK